METMKIKAGLDIGNGYVKGLVSVNGKKPTGVDYLSGVAIQTSSADLKVKANEAGEIIDDIFNEMEASFDSPVIASHTLRLFGKRGIASGKSMEEFDVASTISKAQQDLSSFLIFGSVAGKALQEYWNKNHALPNDVIKVEARISVALPITEYKSYRQVYGDRYKGGTHMVSINNFETPVRIEIKFTDVQVLAEGASAQFAIVDKGEPLMDAMIKDMRAHGEVLDGIKAADIIAAKNTVGIDIGEGTVNFPVFQNGRFNPDASMSFMKGYGTVLEQAADRLRAKNFAFSSRKALADFLISEQTPLRRARYDAAKQIVDEEIEGFSMEVSQEFRKILSRVGSYVEVIYVYGGGANAVKEMLYPKLIETARGFGAANAAYPILYLDSRYSRYLNREGLYLITEQVEAMQASQNGAAAQAQK